MQTRRALVAALAATSLLLCSCSKSSEEQSPQAAAPVGPPAIVMSEVAAWKALGGVTDVSRLGGQPPEPGARNAADVYRPPMEVIASMSPSEQDMLASEMEMSPESLRYVVESYESELATIREGMRLPYCNWGTHFEEGPDAKVEYLFDGRRIARLFIAESIVRADAGDFDGAAASLMDLLKFNDHLWNDRFAICLALRLSVDSIVMEAVIKEFKEHPAEAAEVIAALAKRDYAGDLKKVLLTDGAVTINEYRKAAGGQGSGPIEEQSMSDTVAAELAWYISQMRGFVDQARRPHFEMTAMAEAPIRPSPNVLDNPATDPALINRVCQWASSGRNMTAVAGLVMQIVNYREAHGEYPSKGTLEIPTDAITGQPITFFPTAQGFVLRAEQVGFTGESAELEWEW